MFAISIVDNLFLLHQSMVGNFRYKYRRQFILTTPANETQSKYNCRDESSTSVPYGSNFMTILDFLTSRRKHWPLFRRPRTLRPNWSLAGQYLELNAINWRGATHFDSTAQVAGGTQRQFLENICSEDDLRSRIFGTFVVKFIACLPLLGFSNI